MILNLQAAVLDNHIQSADEGSGPLLQRDYWAVIRGCRLGPAEVMGVVVEKFKHLAPKDLVRFSGPEDRPLEVGDEMEVNLRMGPRVGVRVVDICDGSLTIATLAGHVEAGKITFGAYRNGRGDVIFHIRSRARSKSALHRVGFLAAGDAMQTNTWTDFVTTVAHSVGDGIVGDIVAETNTVDQTEVDSQESSPTFTARTD